MIIRVYIRNPTKKNTNVQKQTDKNSEENFNNNYQEETSIKNSQSNYSTTKGTKNILYTTKNTQENFNKAENKSIDDEVTEVRNFLNILDRKIFLADGSSVHCNQMGNIDIPIKKRKQIIGIPRLEDVLIVPTVDKR